MTGLIGHTNTNRNKALTRLQMTDINLSGHIQQIGNLKALNNISMINMNLSGIIPGTQIEIYWLD